MMKITPNNPPRVFKVKGQELSDCGEIILAQNEQLTFVSPSGKKNDFSAKKWGFYATNSINDKLIFQGLKTALVKNPEGKYYVLIVDMEFKVEFDEYLQDQGSVLVEWLDERNHNTQGGTAPK